MKYLIVIEQTESGYSVFSPDLPGCAAKGATQEETESKMRGAIAYNLDGLCEDGVALPQPTSYSTYIEVAA